MTAIERIHPSEAAEALAGLAGLDPRGMVTEADIPAMCEHGTCLRVTEGSSSAVVVVCERNGVSWIEAAAGDGPDDLTRAIDDALIAAGARALAFQTARPGLVRRAKRLGYRVTGYIMRRDL
jgi:hypothetical protein